MELAAVILAIAALLVSLGALGISWAGLYETALRPAEIEIDYVARDRDILSPNPDGPYVRSNQLWLAIVVSNAGPRGGLLEAVETAAVQSVGMAPDQSFWAEVDSSGVYTERSWEVASLGPGPIALEAGEVRTLWLLTNFRQAPGSDEERAQRLGAMELVTVTVEYMVRRTAAHRPWHLFPVQRGRYRQREQRSAQFQVDMKYYRSAVIDYWRREGHANLAEIAEQASA